MGELKLIKSVSSEMGDRYGSRGGTHYGIDFKSGLGTKVKASESGKVIRAAFNDTGGYGNVIIVDHTPKAGEDKRHIYTLYAHLSKYSVSRGDYVDKGDEVGKSGNTGNAYSTTGGGGYHLHFEVIDSSKKMDWGTGRGATNYHKKVNRVDPERFFGISHQIDGTTSDLSEEEKDKIQERLDVDPHLDFERGIWWVDVMLGGKKVGRLDEHNKELKLSLSQDELDEVLRLPPVSSRTKELRYEIKI